MSAIETFANNTIATVTSGGTTAPAQGTIETWTLSGVILPAASPGITQFHVADVALPSEKILVTNLSGATATVTRGAEGTTPVAHSASGFTIQQVVTAGVLTAMAGSGGVDSVTAADTSIVVGGTGTAPTVRTNTLDVIAADHPAAAPVGMNGQKLTSLANGSAPSDAAAFGQTPAGGNMVTIVQGGTGAATQQGALDAVAGATTANQVLAGNGTHVTLRALAAADLPAATTSVQGATRLKPTSMWLPDGWNTQWLAAKAAAIAGTGTAKIGTIGDSYTVGVSSGTVTDVLTYGWLGRLDALLLGSGMASYAEGYQIAGLAPGGPITNSPSSPYGNSSLPGTATTYDGGIGFCTGTNLNGSTWVTISCPLHPVTGAAPTGIDIFTIDYNTNTWQYSVDGGSAVTISPPSGTPPTGVSGTAGQGIMRRTSITLAGGTSHTVALQQNAANALFLMGHVTYYASTGLGLMRNGLSGTRAVDYATGGGTTQSSTGGVSLTPDHIIPWSGLGPSSVPANNYAYASAAAGFPFNTGTGCDLGIIMLGGNEMFTGTGLAATEKAVSRMISSFRRGVPASSTTPGASVLIVMQPIVSNYSSNYSAWSGQYFQMIKRVYSDMARAYGCGFIDLQEVFGEDPLSRGLFSAGGQQHPTQNGSGAGGGDGHLLIAQTIYGVL